MSRKRRIVIFVVIAFLAVGLILFSTIFRVAHQNVVFSEEIEGVSESDIIGVCGVKSGKSIFLINKDDAKNNIEKQVPYAKVEKIYTTFPNSVNYVISKRVDFCFFEKGGQYYVCDSALKVLRTSTERPDLIQIDAEIGNVSAGDFVANSNLAVLFGCFAETISIEIDGVKSPEFTLSGEKAIGTIKKIVLDGENLTIKTFEGFAVEFDAGSGLQEKCYYLMGILAGDDSSIISVEERESGKTFILEKTSSGMRKYEK